MPPSQSKCTCGHEDSDGRGDVLDCPVHGIDSYPAPPVSLGLSEDSREGDDWGGSAI